MKKEQAIEELLFQSARHSETNNIRWENGFVEQLRRPTFNNSLLEKGFHKIISSIYTLRNELTKENISKEIMSCLFGIIFQINNIQEKDILKWKEHIISVTFKLLDGCENNLPFEFYEIEFNVNLNKNKNYTQH